jgi:hypothetical protein
MFYLCSVCLGCFNFVCVVRKKKLFALCDMDCVCGTAGESDCCDRGHRD